MRRSVTSFARNTARALAGLALLATSAQAQTLPCQGRYNVVSGTVTLAAPGGVVVLTRTRNEGMVDLTYEGCDRIAMVGQGVRMDLVRSATSGWTATLTGGGATRVFNFAALTPRLIDSWMVATGGGMTAQRGMKLTLVSGTEGQPMDCIFDGERQDFSLENSAAQAFLAGRSLTPPSAEFGLSDYYRANETDHDVATESREGSTRHISFLLGTGNAILPGTREATRFREVCRAEDGDLDPPRRLLNFKIHPLEDPDGYAVFAQVIDLQSGKILAQAESEVTGRDDAALSRAMADSAGQLEAGGTEIGALSNGRVP
ncbi:hypothetical protein [Maritimibacter sp. HL-12]|uniref:hypothetical protein n=1 Tax=Maritimibacter sp. HL-12 TaxID=1162418 RepID=UPI000A0F1E5A|nr:hypothetical protein [Maritimibacter sp. HL-12]SMH39949.1 hypothetical protein SAMN05661107_1032 [Maritimibacter sp. HL-12]